MAFKDTIKLYKFANKQRDPFYNLKWRLFVALLIVVLMWFVYTNLQATYPDAAERLISSATSGTREQANVRMFNWFVTGFFAGFLAFAIMFEGEFILASMKLAKQLSQVGNSLKPRSNARAKGSKTRRQV